jgi:dienelactone hydrolase
MTTVQPHTLKSLGPIHPPKAEKRAVKPTVARHIQIPVRDPLNHEAPAIIHEPRSYSTQQAQGAAVVLVSGAGGGVSGPSGKVPPLHTAEQKQANKQGIYPSLADKLALLISIPCIRLDYRHPAQTDYCTADIAASLDYLSQQYNSTRFVIVGWSFGSSPCITAAADEPDRIRGVASIGSQLAGTDGIAQLSPRPFFLLHGADDPVLSASSSQTLYQQYGTEGHRDIKLFPGGDHGLTGHAPEAEGMILAFAAKTLGFEKLLDYETMDQARRDLVESSDERKREMGQGHDLEGGERIS